MIAEHLSKKIAKGAILVFLGMIFGRLIGYLYVMLVARLGSSQYGILSLGIAIVSFLSALATLGLDEGVLRYISYYKGKEDKARIKGAIVSSLRIVIPLSLFFSLIMFIFSKQIATKFSSGNELIPILKIFSFVLPFMVVRNIFLVSMRALQKVKYEITVKEFIERLTRLILTFILIYLGYKVFGAALAYLLAVLVSFVFSIYFLEKKVFPIFKKEIKSVVYPKELLSYSLPLLLGGFLVLIMSWIDTLMLGIFRTVSEVGIYNVASPTAQLMLMAPTALIFLFIPIITELYGKKELFGIKKVYKTTSKWIFLINLPLFLLMILFSKQLLRILFGNEYVAGYSVLIILSLGFIF
mgnify:FL=1